MSGPEYSLAKYIEDDECKNKSKITQKFKFKGKEVKWDTSLR